MQSAFQKNQKGMKEYTKKDVWRMRGALANLIEEHLGDKDVIKWYEDFYGEMLKPYVSEDTEEEWPFKPNDPVMYRKREYKFVEYNPFHGNKATVRALRGSHTFTVNVDELDLIREFDFASED